MRASWTAPLLALLLLAGCAGPQGDADPEPATEADGAGPLDVPGPATEEPSPEPSLKTFVYEAEWNVGWSAAGASNTAMGSALPEHAALGNVTGVVVEMAWTPVAPTAQELTLWARDGEDDARTASGPSPLRLVFDGPEAKGEYRMWALPSGEPAAYAHQAVTFHVTVFRDLQFDPAHSALA